MRISIVAPVDPLVERPGGTRTYVMNLVDGLVKSGVEFSVIGVDYDISDGDAPYDFFPAATGGKISSVRFLRGLMKLAKKKRFSEDTIIHAQRPDYLFPFIFRKQPNKKLCTLHGQMLRSVRERKGSFYGTAYSLLESYSMKNTDHVIAVDRSTLELFTSKYPYLGSKSSLIPVGINLEAWGTKDRTSLREGLGFSPETKVLLYVGRLEKEKNVDLIIKSLPIVRRKMDDCALVVIGDGTKRNELEELSKRVNGKTVRFMGSQPSNVVRDYMAAADVFCLASSFESGPLVVLESLASGTPVVGTDVGMVSKFLSGSSVGRIVQGNEEALAEGVVGLLGLERGEVSYKCLKRAEDFSFKETFSKTLGVYEVLSRKKD